MVVGSLLSMFRVMRRRGGGGGGGGGVSLLSVFR